MGESGNVPEQAGATWAVHRQDDHGNRFVVETGLSRADAERLAELFQARGHKQLYWAEPERPSQRAE